jgi:hypothetical protein
LQWNEIEGMIFEMKVNVADEKKIRTGDSELKIES